MNRLLVTAALVLGAAVVHTRSEAGAADPGWDVKGAAAYPDARAE